MSLSSLRQSPAIVVAALALVAAVGGTAIAGPGASTSAITKQKVKKVAKKQAKKQVNKKFPVTTANIADGAVTNGKLAAGAVTASKLGALTVRLSNAEIVPADGAPGNGLSQARSTEVSCNAGETALGGGVREVEPEQDGAQAGLTVYSERYLTNASGTPTGIRARVGNDFPNDITFRVEALCLAG
jgi:hypothetical protein